MKLFRETLYYFTNMLYKVTTRRMTARFNAITINTID